MDFVYSSLSLQRVREWITYHLRLFKERFDFVLHNDGGVYKEVIKVLKPWMELGCNIIGYMVNLTRYMVKYYF